MSCQDSIDEAPGGWEFTPSGVVEGNTVTGYYVCMRQCYSCGSELNERMEVFRSSACPSCDKDLRVCLNCTFYSPGSHWECNESIDEPVRDKDRATFCSFFSFKKAEGTVRDREGDSSQDRAREDFKKLFGDG